MATPATLEEALALIEKDPVVGFVVIPVIAARAPNPAVIIELRGQRLLLPDWTPVEWLWYARLATQIAERLPDNSPGDKARQLGVLGALITSMASMAPAQKADAKTIGDFYTACVKVVIASVASADQKTRGAIAVEAFKEAFKEAPETIVRALASALSAGKEAILAQVKASAKILKELFNAAASGLGVPSLGTIALIVGLGWLISKRR